MMSARPFDSAPEAPRDFDAGRIGRVTSLGLAVAALGWAALIVGVAAANRWPFDAAAPGHLHDDVMVVAVSLIGSGFALAVIGTLRTGFGALDRFFTAALDRSTSRIPRAASPAPAAPNADAVAASGVPQRRPYNILPDGSVEVETILGTRRFASMAEARDFI